MKILVIEDDKIVRHALKRAFLLKGHQVFVAENGRQGVGLWREKKPDFVLLDIIMPGLDGAQVLSMREDLPETKVAIMSAYTGDQYSFQKLKELADMNIAKPFDDIFEVVQKIEDVFK